MRVIGSALRAYWTAALLGLAAVVLLVLGAPSKAALAGAGFAFTGAAITRGIDLAKERRAAAAQADSDRQRDLDETRRLAYMALYNRSSGGRAELVATLVNALAHHGLAVDPSVAVEHIENLAHGGEHERWLKSQIDRITAELGSLGGESRPVTARLLVTTPQGGAVHRSAFNVSRWQPALKAAGIPAGRENGQYALRHYYASALLARGVDIRALSEYLGHHDPGFTLRTYVHLIPTRTTGRGRPSMRRSPLTARRRPRGAR